MSHFVRIQTQIREQGLLERALSTLNYSYRSGSGLLVRGYNGRQGKAQIVMDTKSSYDIGFQKSEGSDTFEIIADWWGVEGGTNFRRDDFLRKVQRAYAFELVKEHAAEQNLVWESEQVLEDGNTVIILSERG